MLARVISLVALFTTVSARQCHQLFKHGDLVRDLEIKYPGKLASILPSQLRTDKNTVKPQVAVSMKLYGPHAYDLVQELTAQSHTVVEVDYGQEGENFSTGIEKVRQGEQECPDGFFVIIRHLEQLPGGCEGRRELTAWNDLLEAKIGATEDSDQLRIPNLTIFLLFEDPDALELGETDDEEYIIKKFACSKNDGGNILAFLGRCPLAIVVPEPLKVRATVRPTTSPSPPWMQPVTDMVSGTVAIVTGLLAFLSAMVVNMRQQIMAVKAQMDTVTVLLHKVLDSSGKSSKTQSSSSKGDASPRAAVVEK